MAWIKVFDRQGRLVQTIPYRVGRFDYLTVDGQGRLYAVGEDIQVWDRQGNIDKERSRRLTAQLEQIVEQIEALAEDDLPSAVRSGLNVRYLTADESGNLYIEYVKLEGELRTLRLNAEGDRPTLLPYAVPDRRGNVWEIAADPPYEEATQRSYDHDGNLIDEEQRVLYKRRRVSVYDKAAQVVRSFMMPAEPLSAFEQRLTYGAEQKIDGRGHFYQVLVPMELRQEFRGQLLVDGPCYIMEYDSEGRRVGLRAVVGAAYFAAYDDIHNDWDVDRAGNLYYLDFKADRVDVMMVPPSMR